MTSKIKSIWFNIILYLAHVILTVSLIQIPDFPKWEMSFACNLELKIWNLIFLSMQKALKSWRILDLILGSSTIFSRTHSILHEWEVIGFEDSFHSSSR